MFTIIKGNIGAAFTSNEQSRIFSLWPTKGHRLHLDVAALFYAMACARNMCNVLDGRVAHLRQDPTEIIPTYFKSQCNNSRVSYQLYKRAEYGLRYGLSNAMLHYLRDALQQSTTFLEGRLVTDALERRFDAIARPTQGRFLRQRGR
jgi:hypothetical protein